MNPGAIAFLLAVTSISLPSSAGAPAMTENNCRVTSWQMTWGFKESFRAYLSGAIASGEWLTSGGISYSTPTFTVVGTDGMVAADASAGELSSEGNIRFLGHSGLLDQVVSQPQVVWRDDAGALFLDVDGVTQEGVSVSTPQVEFVEVTWGEVELDTDAERVTFRSSKVILTAEGAAAFGTYPEGEPFDPIEISVQLEPGCLEPTTRGASWIGWLAAGLGLAGLAAIPLVRRWRGRERPGSGES